MNKIELTLGSEYMLSAFSSNEKGEAVYKDGSGAAYYNNQPVLMSPAPVTGAPNQGFLTQSGTLSVYSAEGKRRGAVPGSTRRVDNFTIPADVFSSNPLRDQQQQIEAGADEETVKAARVKNASLFLSTLGGVKVKVGAMPARKETVELTEEEFEAALAREAKSRGIKMNEGMKLAKLSRELPTEKQIEIPATPAREISLAELAKEGDLSLHPAEVSALAARVAESIRDAVRLVSDAAEVA